MNFHEMDELSLYPSQHPFENNIECFIELKNQVFENKMKRTIYMCKMHSSIFLIILFFSDILKEKS